METGKDTFDNIQSALSEISFYIDLARRKIDKIGQLDRSAYRLLGELSEEGPLGITTIADKFKLDISTVSRQTAALITKGLIQRISDPKDRRTSLLEITPMGNQKFHEVKMARKTLYRKLMNDWPEKDCQQFEEYLTRLNQSIADMFDSVSVTEH